MGQAAGELQTSSRLWRRSVSRKQQRVPQGAVLALSSQLLAANTRLHEEARGVDRQRDMLGQECWLPS